MDEEIINFRVSTKNPQAISSHDDLLKEISLCYDRLIEFTLKNDVGREVVKKAIERNLLVIKNLSAQIERNAIHDKRQNPKL